MNFYPAIIIRIDKTKLMELPVYKIIINDNDETGCTTISLVDNPAVEMPFLCFSKESVHKLSVDDEKQTISGIAMLSDTPIYRRSERGEYYIVFERDTIRKMVEKYAKNGYFNLVNLQHQSDKYVKNVYMCESLIIDKERGLCPIEFKDVPDGSWYVSYHIEDKELWNEIKTSGHINGFSIEVLSGLELMENKLKHNKMNKLFKLAKTILKLADVVTDKATLIIEGEIEVGKPVFVEVEGEPIEAEDGEYTLEDGRVIVIEGGVIAEIKEVEPAEEGQPVEGEETLEEETPVEEPQEDEKDLRIKELEKELEEKTAKIAELEAEIATLKGTVAEQEEKLKMSVETPLTKKNKVENRENKALKYFS